MHTANTSILASTSLSILLHGAGLAVLLSIVDQFIPEQAVGKGLEIELVSSTHVSAHQKTNKEKIARSLQAESVAASEADSEFQQQATSQVKQLVSLVNKEQLVVKSVISDVQNNQAAVIKKNILSPDDLTSENMSTNALQQQHSILELLHSRIGENKEYPYMARRQRREGKATVAFMLYPDGRVEDTRLINSSNTVALDRAALSAVKKIEPFVIAEQYLNQSEEFQVDVVFELL